MLKKKAMIRFFLIYFCVLLPFFGATLLVCNNFLDEVQAEEENKLLNQLHQVVEILSEDFKEYSDKGVVLFANKEFSTNLELSPSTKVIEATRLLRSLRIFDEYKNDILIYYGQEELYTSDGMERLNTYFARTLACTKKSVSDAIAAIGERQSSITALYGKSGFSYLLFHIPVGQDMYGFPRSMEVIINSTMLEDMLATAFHNDDLIFELSVGNDICWFHYSEQKCDVISEDNISELLKRYGSNPLCASSDSINIAVRMWYESETQLADYYKLRNINLILLAVGLLCSVFFSFGFSTIRFSRLNELLNNILHKNEVVSEKRNWKQNEFDYIQLAVNETIKDSNSARIKRKQYHKALLRQVTMSIFHGVLRERSEVQTALRLCDTELYEDYFFVLGLSVSSMEHIDRIDEMLQVDIYLTHKKDGQNYVFALCELPFGDFDMKKRHELAEAFQQILIQENISFNCMGMSKVYSQISMANYAYLEASSIVNNSTESSQKIHCWEEWIQLNGQMEPRFHNEQMKFFRNALKEKDEQHALELLKQALLHENEKESIRDICYLFLQALTLEIDSISGDDRLELLYEINAIEINDKWPFVEKVSGILTRYFSQQNDLGDFTGVVQFVEENYTNYELSLNMVAEFAGLSKSKTSRLFKMYTGEAYIDYVTRLRMEKARELLEYTDISVKEILQQVGYLDVTNASKKFKAYYQINPSMYRAKIRQARENKTE